MTVVRQVIYLPSLPQTPYCTVSLCQCFRASLQDLWKKKWMASPWYAQMAAIDNTLPTKNFYKGITGYTRAQTSLITQLHTTVNKHLYQIKMAQSPLCPACTEAEESVHHYLFECRAYEHARVGLRRRLGWRSKSLKELLGSHKSMTAITGKRGLFSTWEYALESG